jgi:hypothetical protein
MDLIPSVSHGFAAVGIALFHHLALTRPSRPQPSRPRSARPSTALLSAPSRPQLVASALPYPIYLYAIARFDRRIDVGHVIPLLFIFPLVTRGGGFDLQGPTPRR